VTRLALFDCDGTLVDSQHFIVAAMQAAWDGMGLAPPTDTSIRQTVGLSPHQAMAVFGAATEQVDPLVRAYRSHFLARAQQPETVQPLFPGIREVLEALSARGWLLGVATGKSRRGLGLLLARHGIDHHFVTLQTADDAPSKPHPGMVERALAETGCEARATTVIGDTGFDMEMARRGRRHWRGLGLPSGVQPARQWRAHGRPMRR